MASNLQQTVDYLVTQLQTITGHARVYGRFRSTRSREEFEQLFVGADGLDYWTVRRTASDEVHRGASHQSVRTHRIRLEGHRSASDASQAGNSAEVAMQQQVEAVVEALRVDPSLGGNVEHAQVTDAGVEDAAVAGVAVYRGFVVVAAREALHW